MLHSILIRTKNIRIKIILKFNILKLFENVWIKYLKCSQQCQVLR